MKKLTNYLKENRITFNQISEELIELDSKKFELLFPDDFGLLFNESFHLVCEKTDADGYIYNFGGKYYYDFKEDVTKPKLNRLKYVGKTKQAIKTHNFLGIRGQFELLNGSRLYKDWCKKAKFLGVNSLGLCEKNTLAGTLKFQLECDVNKIKSILGITATVFRSKSDFRYDIKLYAKNEEGWQNLLMVNKELNVTNYKFIEEQQLMPLLENIVVVVDPKSLPFDKIFPLDLSTDVFYQLDTVEYEAEDRDREYLLNLKQYVRSKMKPISITDAFYLDREDSYIKQILNNISNVRENKSGNQYFKSKEEYFYELDSLFNPEDEGFEKIYKAAIENERMLVESCNFKIDTSKRHLPKYKMTDEEKTKYEDNEDMFWALIEDGLRRKCPKGKEKEYIARIEREVDVIKMVNGDNGATGIDYLLILWDIVRYCRENQILVGHGRGSSAGSLAVFMLDITQIDSIKWNLLFERFLNPARAANSLPDIDIDLMPSRKEEVKRYIRSKYGEDQFCYIGIYTTLQLKAAIKDLSKTKNVEYEDVNYFTTNLKVSQKATMVDLFQQACLSSRIKKFVNDNGDIINTVPYVLGLPKSTSIHACATLIFPDEKNIFQWIPVRQLDQDGEKILVSEWEGGELEKSGFLKEDLLVIDQLDKYFEMFKIIKREYDLNIDMYGIDLEDESVIEYFKKGYCQDIFQFGTSIFISYMKKLKADNIHELIDAVALIRPGAMEVNSHNEYLLRKFGQKEIVYKFGTEEITKKTKGLLITQEQIILLCQSLGGFTLAEADDVRKAIGKKQHDLMQLQKIKFLEGAIKKGCPEKEAEEIWHEIEVHGSYSFNLSHSVSYVHISFVGMNLKVHYPIVFWSVVINNDKGKGQMSHYINEINLTGSIKIMPPDINKSFTSVYTDYSTNTIYWALSSVKQVGETSTDQIIEERNKNGEYFSLDEFLERHTFKGSKTNKRVIENLILSGAFDGIEDIRNPIDRQTLIQQFRKRNKVKADEDKDIFSSPNVGKEWWWVLQQKLLSGIAFFNYEDLCSNQFSRPYFDPITFAEDSSIKSKCVVGGYVIELNVRESKKGKFAKLVLENNYEIFPVLIWAEQFEKFEEIISGCEKTLLIISGTIQFDKHNKCNVLQSDENTEMCCLK